MPPVAYLRRSRVDTRRPGTLSHTQQLDEIRRTAARFGNEIADPYVIEDWGRSGRAERQHLRDGFARIEQLVESGEATAVYAYDLSRLGRSLLTVWRLAKLCQEKNVPVRCATGYSPDVTTAEGRMVLAIMASIAEYFAESTKERMQAITAYRIQRGDRVAPAPYGFKLLAGRLVERDDEDPSVVENAFRQAGTFAGAARLLNKQGIAPRGSKGNDQWRSSTVRDMLRRTSPDIIPPTVRRGRLPRQHFRLVGLLRCTHERRLLTGSHGKGGYVAYACQGANEDPNHPYPRTIAESKLLPWITDELSRLDYAALSRRGLARHIAPMMDGVALNLVADTDQAPPMETRAELDEERRRVTLSFIRRDIDETMRDELIADIDARIERLGASDYFATRVITVTEDEPGWRAVVEGDAQRGVTIRMQWTWGSDASEARAAANRLIRSVLADIELGPDLLPLRANWLDSSLRGDGVTRVTGPITR